MHLCIDERTAGECTESLFVFLLNIYYVGKYNLNYFKKRGAGGTIDRRCYLEAISLSEICLLNSIKRLNVVYL